MNATRRGPVTDTDVRSTRRRQELGRVRLYTWLTGAAAAQLEHIAARWGVSKTKAVERAIAEALENMGGEL